MYKFLCPVCLEFLLGLVRTSVSGRGIEQIEDKPDKLRADVFLSDFLVLNELLFA